jgi:hypothetical protein
VVTAVLQVLHALACVVLLCVLLLLPARVVLQLQPASLALSLLLLWCRCRLLAGRL